jgi:hypothetical protein
VWASDLLGRLSSQQWSDAFRAGGYTTAVADRFIGRLREKIAQGQQVSGTAATWLHLPAPVLVRP